MIRRTFVAVAMMALVFACSGGDGPTEPESVVGTYDLLTYDGHPIPWTPEPGFTFVRGTIVLEADWEFAEQLVFDGGEGEFTDMGRGTYEVDGDHIVFTYEGPFADEEYDDWTAAALRAGRRLTLVGGFFGEGVYVYERR